MLDAGQGLGTDAAGAGGRFELFGDGGFARLDVVAVFLAVQFEFFALEGDLLGEVPDLWVFLVHGQEGEEGLAQLLEAPGGEAGLAFGQLFDAQPSDPDVPAVRSFNDLMTRVPELQSVIVPLGDGLWVGVKK